MKRIGLGVFAVICVWVSVSMLFGASDVVEAQNIFKRTAASSDPAAVQAQMASKIKGSLTAKEWPVYVVKVAATKNSPAVTETDTLTFTDRTVISKSLVAGGYSKTGSNYALRVGPDGASVWETMQMHENEKDIVFLRGELPKDCSYMTGAMTYQSPNGSSRTEIFSTYMPKPSAPEVMTSAAHETSAAAVTAASTGAVVSTTTGTTKTTTRTTTRR